MQRPIDILGREQRQMEKFLHALQVPTRQARELQDALATCAALVARDNLIRACEQYTLAHHIAALKEQWAEDTQSSFLPSNEVLHGRYGRRH